MANDKAAANVPTTLDQIAAAVASLTARVTGIETMLAEKVPGFEQVGGRVAELSTAFQEANRNLADLASRVAALAEREPAPAEQRMAAIEQALSEQSARISKVEAAGTRRGRLSSRLAGIEATLERIEQGGTQQ